MKLEFIVGGLIVCLVLFILGVVVLTSYRVMLPVKQEEILGILTLAISVIALALFMLIIGFK